MSEIEVDWRDYGTRIVRSDQLHPSILQTPGMSQTVAITHATTAASKLFYPGWTQLIDLIRYRASLKERKAP